MLHVAITAWIIALPSAQSDLNQSAPAYFNLDAATAQAALLVTHQDGGAPTTPAEVWTTRRFVRNVFGWPALGLGISAAVLAGITVGLTTERDRLVNDVGIRTTQVEIIRRFDHANDLAEAANFTFVAAAATGGLAVICAAFWGSSFVEGSWVD